MKIKQITPAEYKMLTISNVTQLKITCAGFSLRKRLILHIALTFIVGAH